MIFHLLIFHLHSGGRVALANTSAQVVLLFAVLGLQPNLGQTLQLLAQGLTQGEGLKAAPWLFALWAFANAQFGVQRMFPGVGGWNGHLPAGQRAHRRALLLASVVCQAPVILTWLILWLGFLAYGQRVQLVSLVCLAVINLAAAQTALPVTRGSTRLISGGALLLGASLSWTSVLVATLGVLLAEYWAGPLKRRAKSRAPVSSQLGAPNLPWLVAWRALGTRPLWAFIAALLPLFAAWLFLRNNELTPDLAKIGVRVGGGLALPLFLLSCAAELQTRRPPWTWIRSLPWSAQRRLLSDAAFFVVHALPLVVICGWLEPWTLPPLLPLLIYQSVRLAAAMRRDNDSATRLGALAPWEAAFVSLWVAVTPWTSLILAALIPWAIQHGALQEQRLKVTRWRERHYLIEGDPQS